MVLRNVVPRQGTETVHQSILCQQLLIEKCSSPTGDGNIILQSDKNRSIIEKCSSPTGDGNVIKNFLYCYGNTLRNVVPRQGTETVYTALVVYPIKRLRNVVPRQGTETCVIVFTDF